MHINIHKRGTRFAKPGTKVGSSDISFPGKGLMTIPFVYEYINGRWEDGWVQQPIRIETLDNPVPYSMSIGRPFDGLNGEGLYCPIGGVLGKTLFFTRGSVNE